MTEVGLESLRQAVAKGQQMRAAQIERHGQAQANHVALPSIHHTSWVGDIGIGLDQAEAILAALERIPGLENKVSEDAGVMKALRRQRDEAESSADRSAVAMAGLQQRIVALEIALRDTDTQLWEWTRAGGQRRSGLDPEWRLSSVREQRRLNALLLAKEES